MRRKNDHQIIERIVGGMNIGGENGMPVRNRQAPGKERCPDCGDRMTEVDRCNENGVLFVWYECGRNDCDGQWLEKTAH